MESLPIPAMIDDATGTGGAVVVGAALETELEDELDDELDDDTVGGDAVELAAVLPDGVLLNVCRTPEPLSAGPQATNAAESVTTPSTARLLPHLPE